VQKIHTFFSAYTEHGSVLKSFLVPESILPEYLSDSRWEAPAKIIPAMAKRYDSIIDALTHIHTNNSEKVI
jgi:hypothetical protein